MARKVVQQGPAPKAAGKSLIRAADVKPEQLKWLWLDRIPRGQLTLIGGRPGQGKSLFSNFLASLVTNGGSSVIMSNPEDALATVKVPRLIAAGADTRLVHFWPGKLRLPVDVEDLEQLVRFHGVDLVTIDPIAKHVTGKDPNTALEPLAAMAEATGCAVLGIHHLNKRLAKDAHPQEAFGGASGGWLGTVRCAHVLGPTSDGEAETRYLGVAKLNVGDDEKPSCEFYVDPVTVTLPDGVELETARLTYVGDDSPITATAIVHYRGRSSGRGETPEKMKVATEFLILLLRHGPVKANDVFKAADRHGVSKMTLQRAAKPLRIVKTRIGFGVGSHMEWSLPADNPIFKMMGVGPSVKNGGKNGGDDDVDQVDIDELIADLLSGEEMEDDDE